MPRESWSMKKIIPDWDQSLQTGDFSNKFRFNLKGHKYQLRESEKKKSDF